ncbi:unnamed protein product [Protopolystoma xenopodis]|uniref:Uncharacterized protein n=1 Tax=Protopolystoma xenopodis TaxID=117903 RepID=A0A3S5CPF8_9PLAT|nr:unnamed protein product [Protopolystoma xenopodis]
MPTSARVGFEGVMHARGWPGLGTARSPKWCDWRGQTPSALDRPAQTTLRAVDPRGVLAHVKSGAFVKLGVSVCSCQSVFLWL